MDSRLRISSHHCSSSGSQGGRCNRSSCRTNHLRRLQSMSSPSAGRSRAGEAAAAGSAALAAETAERARIERSLLPPLDWSMGNQTTRISKSCHCHSGTADDPLYGTRPSWARRCAPCSFAQRGPSGTPRRKRDLYHQSQRSQTHSAARRAAVTAGRAAAGLAAAEGRRAAPRAGRSAALDPAGAEPGSGRCRHR